MAATKSKPTPSKAATANKSPVTAKAAVKPTPRRSAPVAAKVVKAAKAAKAVKPAKPKKDKLVRDSFTIPKSEYLVIDALKQRAAKLGSPAKRSEVMRAGIKALAAMADAAYAVALKNVPAIKTGRPSKT